jgi:putative transposase
MAQLRFFNHAATRALKRLRRRSVEAESATAAPKAGDKRGRKVRADRVGLLSHVPRPVHEARHPVHVTMRRVAVGPSFRAERVRRAIEGELYAVKKRGVVVVHYSIQDNHLHLMVEATDRVDLGRKMKLLFSRIAMTVNRIALRAGKLFADRHHRHELTTPTEVRRALVYILFNDRKHHSRSRSATTALDEASSAIWVTDWSPDSAPAPETLAQRRANYPEGPPITAPATWLARTGWRRAREGLLRTTDHPRG